jgi:hypothetical protein
MNLKLILGLALVFGGGWAGLRADEVPGVDWYVANAKIIEVVQAETPAQQAEVFPSPLDRQRVWVADVLKGVDTTQEFLLPKGSLNPGQSGVVLFQYEPPGYQPALQISPEAPPVTVVWPIDSAGTVETHGISAQSQDKPLPAAGITLDVIKKDVAASTPEEVGLNLQLLDALLFPEKFEALAQRDANRATYVRFWLAILDLNRDLPALAQLLESPDRAVRTAAMKKLEALTGTTVPAPQYESPPALHQWAQAWAAQIVAGERLRWPPVPADLKLPPEAFPEPLLQALRRNDADGFSHAFAVWLDSGVRRDREIQFAANTLNPEIVRGSNLSGAIGGSAYLPPAPRLRADVLFNSDIPAEDRMKAIALRAQLAHGDRFARERAAAKAVVTSAPPDSDLLRRAAFWELRDANIDTAGRVALERLARNGEDEPTQRFVLGLFLSQDTDDGALDAARIEIQAGRQTFIASLFAYLQTHRDDKARWIGRLFCQEGQKQVVPVMVRWLKDGDAQVRKAAALNLCWLPSADAVPNLLDAIHSENDPEVKEQMLVALAQTGDERGLETLLKAAREPLGSGDAEEIVRGLGRIRDPRALPALADIVSASKNSKMEDDNYGVLADAVNAFGYISHLDDAHAPDRFQTGSMVYPTQLKLGIVHIEEWRKSQASK